MNTAATGTDFLSVLMGMWGATSEVEAPVVAVVSSPVAPPAPVVETFGKGASITHRVTDGADVYEFSVGRTRKSSRWTFYAANIGGGRRVTNPDTIAHLDAIAGR